MSNERTHARSILLYKILPVLWEERFWYLCLRVITLVPLTKHSPIYSRSYILGNSDHPLSLPLTLAFYSYLWCFVCFGNKLDNSPEGIKIATKIYTKQLEFSSKVFSSKQGEPLLKVMVKRTDLVKGSCCCHNPLENLTTCKKLRAGHKIPLETIKSLHFYIALSPSFLLIGI